MESDGMQVLKDPKELRLPEGARGTAIAIGKFDGVHRGHRLILQEILAAKESGLVPCVFTFDPDPASFFAGRELKHLITAEEKRNLFLSLGIDRMIEYPMNAETASVDPEEFIRRILYEELQCRMVAAGEDLTFGDGGRGDVRLLEKVGKELGMKISVMEKLTHHGEIISSTAIRGYLDAGDLKTANEMLGWDYSKERMDR